MVGQSPAPSQPPQPEPQPQPQPDDMLVRTPGQVDHRLRKSGRWSSASLVGADPLPTGSPTRRRSRASSRLSEGSADMPEPHEMPMPRALEGRRAVARV